MSAVGLPPSIPSASMKPAKRGVADGDRARLCTDSDRARTMSFVKGKAPSAPSVPKRRWPLFGESCFVLQVPALSGAPNGMDGDSFVFPQQPDDLQGCAEGGLTSGVKGSPVIFVLVAANDEKVTRPGSSRCCLGEAARSPILDLTAAPIAAESVDRPSGASSVHDLGDAACSDILGLDENVNRPVEVSSGSVLGEAMHSAILDRTAAPMIAETLGRPGDSRGDFGEIARSAILDLGATTFGAETTKRPPLPSTPAGTKSAERGDSLKTP